MKTCTKCGKTKHLEDFFKDKQKTDGLTSCCKVCKTEQNVAHREANLEEVRKRERDRRKERYQKNKEKETLRNKAWALANAERVKEIRKKYHVANPTKRENAYLLREYGITLEQYNQILTSQRGCCEICGNEIPNRKQQHLDHNHITKKVRGILCANCNRGLGHFKDNPFLLDVAAHYLRTSESFWRKRPLERPPAYELEI